MAAASELLGLHRELGQLLAHTLVVGVIGEDTFEVFLSHRLWGAR